VTPLEAFLVSGALVAIAEIGDKTQLLALMLAARYRAPVAIIAGIFAATVVNHGLSAWAGVSLADWVDAGAMRWIIGVSFLAMAAWMLVPDTCDGEPITLSRAGAFFATCIAFFMLEIGDKTQFATIALAARFQDMLLVTAGSTLGMLIADAPVVVLGGIGSSRIPLKLIRPVAALLFAGLGAAAIFNVDRLLPG